MGFWQSLYIYWSNTGCPLKSQQADGPETHNFTDFIGDGFKNPKLFYTDKSTVQ